MFVIIEIISGIYSNCQSTALAVYMHATDIGCNQCCLEKWKNSEKIVVGGVVAFVAEGQKFPLNHICYIKMQQSFGHVFVLEMRQKDSKRGFLLYSSYANLFTLKYFLGLDSKMRSGMGSGLEEEVFDDDDLKVEKLRSECGLKQFLEIEKLKKCVQLFSGIDFDENNDIQFVFVCKPLNNKFKYLKHSTKLSN